MTKQKNFKKRGIEILVNNSCQNTHETKKYLTREKKILTNITYKKDKCFYWNGNKWQETIW